MTAADTNPFPGPQAYGWDERAYFFGRAKEIEQLTSLVLSSSATLVYARSGTGKSSLIQAGLIPHLQEGFAFQVLPVVHLGTGARADHDEDTPNQFVHAVSETICHPDTDPVPAGIAAAAATRRKDDGTRVLLVLDQFEEVFNDPTLWRQREEFFTALTEALRDNTWLCVIIALRSDYLAELVLYEHVLPDDVAVRYQLEPLTEAAASTAIQSAFEASDVALSEADRAAVLDLLLKNPNSPLQARHVNTIQLQILCRQLWEDLQGEGPRPNLDRALTTGLTGSMIRFVDDAVAKALTRVSADEATIRWWLDDKLVTETGRRAFVQVGEEETAGLPNSVLDELARVKLVQIEQRPGSKLAELPHDSMTEGVHESFERWRQARARKRRRVMAALFVLLMLVVASFPLMLVSDDEPPMPLVERSLTLDQEELRIPFRSGADAVVADLVVNNVSSGSLTMHLVAEGHDVTRSLGTAQIKADAAWSARVAVPATPDETYEVVLATKTPDKPVDLGLTVWDLPLLAESDDSQDGITTQRFGVALNQDGPEVLRVENARLTEVGGVRVLAQNGNETVVESDRGRSIAILTLIDPDTAYDEGYIAPVESAPISATVTRRPLPTAHEVTLEKPARITADRYQLMTLTIERTEKPLALEGQCDRPARIVLIPQGRDTAWTQHELGQRKISIPLDRKPGSYPYLVTYDPQERARCDMRIRPFDAPSLRTFGTHDTEIPQGQGAAALSLQLPSDALITAQGSTGLYSVLRCSPPAQSAVGDDDRMFALVPRNSDCTLWLHRSDDETGKVPLRLTIAPIPAEEG